MSSERRERKAKENIRKMMGLRTGEEVEGRFFHKEKHRLREGTEGTPHQALDVKVKQTGAGSHHNISRVSVFSSVNDRAGTRRLPKALFRL